MVKLLPILLSFLLLTNAIAETKKATTAKKGEKTETEEMAAAESTEAPAPTSKRKKKQGIIQELSGQGYGMSGCGLGSMLFGESESRGIQILSATTNYFYANQTLAISSGTSNCAPTSEASSEARLKNTINYIAGNFEILKNEIAQNQGKTLAGLTSVMGCQSREEVGTFLQSHYQNIYPENVNTQEKSNFAGKMIFELIASNKNLKTSCQI